jgi:hypothetical protein
MSNKQYANKYIMIDQRTNDVVQLQRIADDLRQIADRIEDNNLVGFVCMICGSERKFDLACFIDRGPEYQHLIDFMAETIRSALLATYDERGTGNFAKY